MPSRDIKWDKGLLSHIYNCTISIVMYNFVHHSFEEKKLHEKREKKFFPKCSECVALLWLSWYIYHIIVWTKSHGICCKQLRCRWTKRERTNEPTKRNLNNWNDTYKMCVSCCRLPLSVSCSWHKSTSQPANQTTIHA